MPKSFSHASFSHIRHAPICSPKSNCMSHWDVTSPNCTLRKPTCTSSTSHAKLPSPKDSHPTHSPDPYHHHLDFPSPIKCWQEKKTLKGKADTKERKNIQRGWGDFRLSSRQKKETQRTLFLSQKKNAKSQDFHWGVRRLGHILVKEGAVVRGHQVCETEAKPFLPDRKLWPFSFHAKLP